jgi:hypothetical protein
MFPRTLFFLLACAGIGYLLGRSRGMPLQGLLLGFAFGPLGWGLILLWPASWIQPIGRVRSEPRSRPRPPPESQASGNPSPGAGRACPRCARPVAPEAGACAHCGNVLVPVKYRVG